MTTMDLEPRRICGHDFRRGQWLLRWAQRGDPRTHRRTVPREAQIATRVDASVAPKAPSMTGTENLVGLTVRSGETNLGAAGLAH